MSCRWEGGTVWRLSTGSELMELIPFVSVPTEAALPSTGPQQGPRQASAAVPTGAAPLPLTPSSRRTQPATRSLEPMAHPRPAFKPVGPARGWKRQETGWLTLLALAAASERAH